jgi:hypothetical protein
MPAFELCSCHSGNTQSANAFGVFADATVTAGDVDIKSDGDEHPANSATANAPTKNFMQVTPVERAGRYHWFAALRTTRVLKNCPQRLRDICLLTSEIDQFGESRCSTIDAPEDEYTFIENIVLCV